MSEGKQNEFLLRFIKPLVQKICFEFKITVYPFPQEPDGEIRFRVLTTPQNMEKVRGLINNAKGMSLVKDVKYPENQYLGERDAFGEDGWRTAYKSQMLEAISH
ncbi:MAG: hypothetical protein V1850_01085 [Candidatus Bathyarchaeota archaeon]